MFWRYHQIQSNIDSLLEREDVTLHQLMDEDDVIQECKGQNHKLIEFLITPQVMEELIKLITCEPGDDVEDKVKFKYPNIACELLTSDVSQILDRLVEDNVLIDRIYAFLDTKEELNPLLASFFTKVLGLLLVRKAEFLFEYLKSKDDFLQNLLNHLGTSAIMDLLMRLITCDMYDMRPKILQWLEENSLIEKLVSLIHPSQVEEIHCNAATTLCDIVRAGREQLGMEQSQPDPLLDKVETDEILSQLLTNMLDGDRRESVITNGLQVLQTILEYRRQVSSFDDWRPIADIHADQLPAAEADRMQKAINSVLKAVKPRLGELARLLTEPPVQSIQRMETTVGVLEPPLGNTRLQVSRLFATLFAISDSDLHLCLIEHDVVNKLLDLFFQYVWNNFLHSQVELLVCNILLKKGVVDESPRSLDEANAIPITVSGDEDTPLVTHLFKDCNVVQRMIKAWRENEEFLAAGQQRRGYMGHVTRICNHLVAAMDRGPYAILIDTLFTEMPSDSSQAWNSLVNEQLAETNKRNQSDLVGGHPLNSSSGSDSDSDFRDIPFPQDDTMQQAFSDYQMQQLTSTFIDQFGLNEEEFGEPNSRIDSAFTEKIASLEWNANPTEIPDKHYIDACNAEVDLDTSSDEEDVWKDKEVLFKNTASSSDAGGRLMNTGESGPAAVSSLQDSADSGEDSSDEELSSPAVIKSKSSMDPDMDVDPPVGASLPGASSSPDTTVAMDTSPWDTTATKVGGGSGADEEEWAEFESAPPESGAGWADFSNMPAEDGGPRVSSPDALIDSSSDSNNPYIVSDESSSLSKPADEALSCSPAASSSETDTNSSSSKTVTSDSTTKSTESCGDASLNESVEQEPLSDDEKQELSSSATTGANSASDKIEGKSVQDNEASIAQGTQADKQSKMEDSHEAFKPIGMEVDEPVNEQASQTKTYTDAANTQDKHKATLIMNDINKPIPNSMSTKTEQADESTNEVQNGPH